MSSMALSPPKPRKGNTAALPQTGEGKRSTRLLITVTVFGSAGPIRFVVDEGDLVAAVIRTALKLYAREGRLPVLGSDLNDFLLYRANAGAEALNPWEPIGLVGSRNFLLCKKSGVAKDSKLQAPARAISAKSGGGSWKAWLNKSFHFKVTSH